MNVNLTTIVALSACSTQPAGGHSANRAGISDDATATSAGDNQVASGTATNRTGDTDNEVSEKASTTSSTKEPQASQSDDTQTKVTDKTGGKTRSDFNKVLKKRLKQDEAETDRNAEQDTTQSQTSVANDAGQTAQACSLPVIQVEVAAPNQQQPAEDASTSIQRTPIIPQTDQPAVQINQTGSQTDQTTIQTSQPASQTDQTTIQASQPVSQLPVHAVSVSLPQTQTVNNGVQVALQDTQGQVVQLDALQQAQISVSDEAQIQNSTNAVQATEPTTQQMPQISVINQGQEQQQGQEQTQPVPVQMSSTNTSSQDVAGTTRKNTDNGTVKSDVPVKSSRTDSGTPAATSNQDKINFNANAVLTYSANQADSEQPKAQSVDLTSTTTNQNEDMSYVPITTTMVDQQAQISVSDEAQIQDSTNAVQATEPTTQQMPQISVINQGQEQQQGQEQTQPVPLQMSSTNTSSQDVAGTTRKNTDNGTVKSDVPVKSSRTDSSMSAATSNQDKINFNANAVSTYSANQADSEQPKAQSVDLTSTTTNQNEDMSYVPITTTMVDQQAQISVSDEAQIQDSTNAVQATEPTTQQMPQISVINQGQEQQQGQEQTQAVPVQMPSTNTSSQDVAGTTRKNTDNDTVKSDVPVKSSRTDSGTPAATSNQDKINFNANAVLTYSANQADSEQPKAQSVDLTSTTTNQNEDMSYVPITTTMVDQQAGKETTTHNNAQNKSGSNQQDNPLLSTNSRTTLPTVNGLAGEFNKTGIETVSLQNTVSQPQTKSQTDGLSVQSLGLQAMATTATTSHVTDAQPVIASHSTATTNSTSAQDTTASLREQICMSVQNSLQQGQRQITINLNPPELGRVSIKFTEQGGQLTGSLEATNPQTRTDIQQAMPEMIRSLEQSGISIKRIDVSLSDISGQSSQDFSRESASHNQWEQLAQQGFDDTNGGRFYQDSYVASSRFSGVSEFGGDTGSGWNQSSSSENLLNVLI